MSVTTTQPPGDRGGPRGSTGGGARSFFSGSLFSGRVRRTQDDTPTEMMEFYSPSTALASVPAKPAARNAVLLICSMVAVIFVLFGVLKIDRIVTAGGKIVSLTPEVVVQPANTAIVKTIAVSMGDIVRKGQLLAQLDPTFAAADSTAALDQVDRYQTEIDRLNAENRQVQYRPRQLTPGALVQEGIFAQRAAAREAELRYYQGQIEAQKALELQANAAVQQYAKETGVAVDVEKMRVQLEHDQVGSRIDTLAAVTARLETEREVLVNVQQGETARQNIVALKGQLDNYNQQWFADVSQTITSDAVQLATYRDQLEHAALNYKLIDLRAEQDAIVLSVAPVSVGAVLQPGQTFFTLVPLNAPLEIDAQMTGDQAGFVFPGQAVQVKFTTFPSTNFGMGHGAVRLVSADSFLTNGGGAPPSSAGTTANSVFTGPATTSPYFYDVRITLDRLALQNVPKDTHLVPGMPVEADIRVGNRTIWEYLLEHLMPIVNEGMREPT
jgi:HlyD family secretion protein